MRRGKTIEGLVDQLLSNELHTIRYAKESLLKLGEAAIPLLIQRIGEDDWKDDRIGKFLRVLGPAGKAGLRQVLSHGTRQQKCGALRALWEFESDAVAEIPLLIEYLGADDAEVRWRATHALGRIGEAARSTAAKVVDLAYDVNPKVQCSALFALSQMDYDSSILAEICFELLGSAHDRAIHAAITTLKKISQDPLRVAGRLLEILSGCKPSTYNLPLIELLGASDELPEGGPQTLERFVRTPGIRMVERGRALEVLWKHTGDADLVLPVLADFLAVGEGLESICDTVAFIGPSAEPLVPLLIDVLKNQSNDWDASWAAVDALGSIGSGAAAAAPILHRMEDHPSDLLRARAREALRRIGAG